MSRNPSPFRLSVLMPAWIIRTVFMLVPFLLCIVFLAIYVNSKDTLSRAGVTFANRPQGEVIGMLATAIALTFLCYILDLAAVILYATRNLSGKIFLIFSTVQTTMWTVVLAAAIVLGTWAITAFVLIVYLFFLGILVYIVTILRRDRKDGGQRGDYEKTGAVEHLPQMQSSLSVMSGAIQNRYTPVPGNRHSSLSYT